MFRVYSGKWIGAIDDEQEKFSWSVTVVPSTPADHIVPIASGKAPSMEEAIIDTYRAMAAAQASKGGHESDER